MRKRARLLPAVLLAGLTLGAAPALAATDTYNVTAGGADGKAALCTGSEPTFTCPNLRAAVAGANADASPPALIQLKAGTYALTEGALELTKPANIAGTTSGPRSLIERTGGEGALVEVAAAASLGLSNIRMSALESPPWKAAINGGLLINHGSLTITESEISGSKPAASPSVQARGGAIFNDGQLAIRTSSLSNDQALGGAGSETEGSGEGGAAAGGAIYSAGGSVTITASTLNGDQAIGGAGAPRPKHSGPGGKAEGGAIMIAGGTLTLVNDTITGNFARGGVAGEGIGTGLPGQAGQALAGGIMKRGPEEAVIASTTIAINSVTSPISSAAGDLYLASGTTTIMGTIIASGAANFDPACLVLSPAALNDAGHNLEDDGQAQCGFSAAKHDVAAPALLLAPAGNGGEVHTIGLLPGSPALGAAGRCTDPTALEAPLLSDARGEPRPVGECDIGAFQAQPVVAGTPPIAAGTPAVGQTMTCGTGTWGGDGPLSYSYEWLRNGAVIAGVTAATYTLTTADAAQQLTCRVTARGPRGQAVQTGLAVSIAALPAPPRAWPAPVISRVSQTARTWKMGTGLPHASRALPAGTRFNFSLNEAAIVTFTFSRPAAGRLLGRSCQVPSPRNARHRRCTRQIKLGSFTFLGLRGVNHVSFRGRISPQARLGRGTYTLTITAKAHERYAKARSLSFTIAG